MTDNKTAAGFSAFFGKICQRAAVLTAGIMALGVLLSPLGTMNAHAASGNFGVTNGELWIGGTQVTTDNCDNVFGETGVNGEPTARYVKSTKTLYLNGVNITDYVTRDGKNYSLYVKSLVDNLVITGYNDLGKNQAYLYNKEFPTQTTQVKRTATIVHSCQYAAITGNGTLRSDNSFVWEIGKDYTRTCKDFSVLFGSYEEKTGPTLEFGGEYGIKIDPEVHNSTEYYMYGGMLKGKAKSEPGISLTAYYTARNMVLYNDSILVAKTEDPDKYTRPIEVGPSVGFAGSGLAFDYLEGDNWYGEKGWVIYGPKDSNFIIGLDNTDIDPTAEDYLDTDINVWGFTGESKVYSVDVEWGAMTFQYEKSSWDAESHTTKEGRGWLVYDNQTGKTLKTNQDAINQITVTNHSNAGVYATLVYAGEAGYADTTGGFTTKAEDADTNFTDAADTVPAYLTLGSADNDLGSLDGQGKETVGTVYFMPEGIAKTDDTVNDITKWTKIGKITVGILIEQPTN